MSTARIPTGPALAAESPPGKEIARPSATKDEREEIATNEGALQESAFMELCKGWMRASGTDRKLFLADIRAGCPNLWKAIERESGGRNV